MKPSFALNLSDDGVTLLHRSGRGWTDVGNANFADPDFADALDYMRSTALGLSPKGIATKLVIPNSQILYTTVTAPGPSEKQRRAQIAKALEGRTPYAVDDLVFDWSGDGPDITVAVIAKETLDEAEAFATEHRFNPVSFVAIPDSGFAAEPFFGMSKAAATILPEGQTVERDTDLLKVVSRDGSKTKEQAESAAVPETVPVQAEPDPVRVEEASDDLATPVSSDAEDAPAADEDVFVPPEAHSHQAADPADFGAEAEHAIEMEEETDVNSVLTANANVVEDEPFTAPSVEAAPVLEIEPDPIPEPVPAAEVSSPSVALSRFDDEIDEAPMAVDVPPEDDIPPMPAHLKASRGVAQPSVVDDDLPPAPSSAAMVAFASRRAAEAAAPIGGQRAALTAPEIPRSAPELGGVAKTAAPKAPAVERPPGAKPPPKFSYDDPVPPPPRMPGDPPVTPVQAAQKAAKGLKSIGSFVTAPGIAGTKAKKPVPGKPAQQAMKPAETTNATVSPDSLGRGLGARRAPQRGKPKYLGLIMTGILLLLLAIVAAWSSVYLTQREVTPETEVATADPALSDAPTSALPEAPDPVAADIADSAVPSIDDEAAADGEDLSPVEAADTAAPAEETTVAAAEPLAAPEPAPQTGLESDASTAAPPSQLDQDEIFLAGMDTPPASSDPLTLPSPTTAADALPALPSPPPPFGTVYQFDADGRIVPTPEGIMTPEGVLLVAGKPPVLPPPRPASVEQAVAAVATTAPTAPAAPEADLTPVETFAADPTLADARPRGRPAELVPAAPAAGEDDASLAPAEDSRFASLRPRLRPASVLAAGEESRLAAENASLAAQAAIAAAAESAVAEANADGSISPLAVAVSRIPAPRPRDLNRAVEAAVAAATQAPSRKEAAAPEDHAAEEGDEEPEAVSAAPRIPTKTNVAKQATFVNAINLSKVNLIGVYGTQSKRYALIRQSNGRYKKVRVGDRFDGGTIKAITSNEVRYQKGGRLVALGMPKG